jgi:HK97 family phage major capsid protein
MTKKVKVPQKLFRAATIEPGSIDAEKKTLRMSISSDTPYLRYDYWNDEEYWEILDHAPGGVDDTRLIAGLPILFNHDRDKHLGRATSFSNDGHKCTVDVQFSESDFAQEKMRDAGSGVLPDTSVGYQIDDDDGECIGATDGIPVYRFKWAPYEASLVTIPADISVGVGRQRDKKPEGEPKEISVEVKKDIDTSRKDEKTDSQERDGSQKGEKKAMPDENKEAAEKEAQIKIVAERADSVKQERDRVKKINDYVGALKNEAWKDAAKQVAAKAIEEGKDFDTFRTEAINSFEGATKVVTPDPNAGKVGMGTKDLERYSIVRAINCLASKRPLDGVEKAAHDAHVKLTGRETEGIGFFIPHDVMSFNRGGINADLVRTLFTNVYAAAGAFVGTDLLAGSLIELLRNKLAVVKLGARTLSGLVGNVAIPLQSGGATATWLAENATISESVQTVGQLALTPHRLGASTSYTYQLLAQSSVDVENFVREDLMRVLALAKDLAAIAGTGVSGQPLGILNTSNLSTSVTFANAQTMLYTDALIFENNVAINNADMGKLGYLTTPTVRKNAKSIAEISAANSIPVWKNDMVNGFGAFATNQVPTATSVLFGNWDDLILADWAGSQVIVDPYSLSLQGQVRVVMQQLCDNGIRHSKSFAVSTN